MLYVLDDDTNHVEVLNLWALLTFWLEKLGNSYLQ